MKYFLAAVMSAFLLASCASDRAIISNPPKPDVKKPDSSKANPPAISNATPAKPVKEMPPETPRVVNAADSDANKINTGEKEEITDKSVAMNNPAQIDNSSAPKNGEDSALKAEAGSNVVVVSEMCKNEGYETKTKFDSIYFDFDMDTISEESQKTLKDFAEWLAGVNLKIGLEGHCDERGDEEYNTALGARRAGNAKKYLQSFGVSEGRMILVSCGTNVPVCTEHTDECWAKNRRVRFVVIKGDK